MLGALSPQLLPASGSAVFPHFLLETLLWRTEAKEEAPHPNTTTLALGNLTSLFCHDWSSPVALCNPLTTKAAVRSALARSRHREGMSGRDRQTKNKVYLPGFNNKWRRYHILFICVSMCMRISSLLRLHGF